MSWSDMMTINWPNTYRPENKAEYDALYHEICERAVDDFMVFCAGMLASMCKMQITYCEPSRIHDLETYNIGMNDGKCEYVVSMIRQDGELVFTTLELNDPEIEGNETVSEGQLRMLWDRYRQRELQRQQPV
jgi:hypothetical protein